MTGDGAAPGTGGQGLGAGLGQARGFFGVWLGWWKGAVITKDLFPLGFSFEKDTRLYFDDTCVVPERLEGKNPAPEEGLGATRAHGGRFGSGLHSSWLFSQAVLARCS